VELARWLGRKRDFDLAILYLGAVDSLGHQLLAQRGRQELSDAEVARFHAALERGLRAVDRRLARILDGLDLTRTRVVLASDHGMVPVLHDVSLRAALVGLDPRIRVITAAGAGFVHLPPGVPATVVKRRLSRIQVGGKRVFAGGRVVLAEGLARLGLPAGAADLFVQAAPGFSLSYRRTKTLTGWPRNQATHGFRSDLPAMHGVFLAAGPGVRAGRLGRLHMTQVAGAVSDAVGMARPRQARPGPAKLWKVPLAKRQAKRRATGGR
jgi:arylsulfatase A-like enzyme